MLVDSEDQMGSCEGEWGGNARGGQIVMINTNGGMGKEGFLREERYEGRWQSWEERTYDIISREVKR